MTNTKCLTSVCTDARSFFDPQTLHRQLLHVVLCRSNFYDFFLQGISIHPQHSILLKYWHKDKLKYWHKYKLKLWHKCIFKMWQKYNLKSWHRYKYKSGQIQNVAVQWLCVGHDPGVTRQGCSLAQGWRGQGSLLQTQKYTNT